MLSPAKRESEAELDLLLHSSSPRSEPQRLSLVLSLPNPTEAASQSSTLEEPMSTSRRSSTRINCNSPKEIDGGEGRVKPSSPGTSGCQARRSPRFAPVDGEIDNVSSVPITGKIVSSERKISSAPVKVSRQILVK